MKQYLIDELRPEDYEKLKDFFNEYIGESSLNGIYWISLDDNLLSETQIKHKECRPFYFAIDLEPDRIACELLVRTQNNLRCTCISYATEKQRNWFINYIDAIFTDLKIIS